MPLGEKLCRDDPGKPRAEGVTSGNEHTGTRTNGERSCEPYQHRHSWICAVERRRKCLVRERAHHTESTDGRRVNLVSIAVSANAQLKSADSVASSNEKTGPRRAQKMCTSDGARMSVRRHDEEGRDKVPVHTRKPQRLSRHCTVRAVTRASTCLCVRTACC